MIRRQSQPRDFDFLIEHGFGVVYGEEAVRQKIFELGSFEPNKGNNMNEITEVTTTTEVPFDLGLVEILDEDGNPTGRYLNAGAGETASTAATVYTTAEDGEHEVVTVH